MTRAPFPYRDFLALMAGLPLFILLIECGGLLVRRFVGSMTMGWLIVILAVAHVVSMRFVEYLTARFNTEEEESS